MNILGPEIRINLIGDENILRTKYDMNVFQSAWKQTANIHKTNSKITRIPSQNYNAPLAHLNIFFGKINPTLFLFANCNIFIPNQNEVDKNVILKYLIDDSPIHEIWVKTKYLEHVLQNYEIIVGGIKKTITPQIKHIGWTSYFHSDILSVSNHEKKHEAVLFVPDDTNNVIEKKRVKFVIENWMEEYPHLNIYIQKRTRNNLSNCNLISQNENSMCNITIHHSNISRENLERIQNETQFHICPFQHTSFSHTINEGRRAGSCVIIPDGFPFNEFNITQIVKSNKKRFGNENYFGSKYNVKKEEWNELLQTIFNYDTDTLSKINSFNRSFFNKDRTTFLKTIGFNIKNLFIRSRKNNRPPAINLSTNHPPPILLTQKPTLTEYPIINIITITKERQVLFPLPISCINGFDYPKDKIRWIVVEDGVGSVEPLIQQYCSLPSNQITYRKLDNVVSIGEKRNIAISLTEDMDDSYIMMMDDDDYYRPNYIKNHLILFKHLPEKRCHYCSTIGIFHLTKMYSMINSPPINIAPEKRISEATLFFKKNFWRQRQFPEIQIAEGEGFMENRTNEAIDITWEKIFVSFLHAGSTSSRDTYEGEPNGCHYGFDDNFFLFITNLGKQIEDLMQSNKN
jgi:hypothetical protein